MALQRFLSIAENTVKAHYPSSAKLYLRLNHGLPLSHRKRAGGGSPTWQEEELTRLRFLFELMETTARDLGIAVPDAARGEMAHFSTARLGEAAENVW
uniref:Uncharacterized protein n=1 Tax=Bicosoecida sp. CB-2014 TaxID=1486930 RepID=A0A7S1CKZ3_9STRA